MIRFKIDLDEIIRVTDATYVPDDLNAAIDRRLRRPAPKGWDLFHTGKEDTPFEIQRIDDEEVFDGDGSAWEHVWNKALSWNLEAIETLAFIRKFSPKEWGNICNYMMGKY